MQFFTKYKFTIFFTVVFISVTSVLGYYSNLRSQPEPLHIWRKTDGLSQIDRYTNNGLNFFDFGSEYNQLKTEGKAVAEFPLHYYTVAVLNKICGHHISNARWVWLLYLFFGLLCLGLLTYKVSGNIVFGLVTSHVLFLSHVFNNYSIEFLPDPIALSYCFMGLYAWYLFYHSKEKKHMNYATIALLLCGITKVYFLIPAIAIGGTVFVQVLLKRVSIHKFLKFNIPLILAGIGSFAWIKFTIHYNTEWYPNNMFLANILPYWSTEQSVVETIIEAVKNKWIKEYFFVRIDFLIYGLAFLLIFLTYKSKQHWRNLTFAGFCLLGGFSFIILFFFTFRDHDYYVYPLFFIIVALLVLIGAQLKVLVTAKTKNVFSASFGLLFLLAFGQYYLTMDDSLNRTEFVQWEYQVNTRDFSNLGGNIDSLKISPDDKIVVLSDNSPQAILYFMKKKGWSYNNKNFGMTQQYMIDNGAKYWFQSKHAFVNIDSTEFTITGTNPIYEDVHYVVYDTDSLKTD